MRSLFALGLILLSLPGIAQRYAVANGDWNSAIWAATPVGIAGSAATPTSGDDVYTNGSLVTVTSSVACNNLYIRANVSQSLSIGDNIITINGELGGVDGVGTPAFPSVADALDMDDFGELRFVGGGQKINRWRYVNPLVNVTFSPGVGNTASINSGIRVVSDGQVILSSGTLTATNSTSREFRGCSTCSFLISPGATLATGAPINGGGSDFAVVGDNTLFGTITINGTLTTTSYVNAQNLFIGNAGLLQTAFNGANQTEGWWYDTNRPVGGTLQASSTIEFNASANQTVYTKNYGNLTLSGSGTKTVAGSGSIHVTGNLLYTNSAIVLSSSFPVVFDGPNGQSISGGSSSSTAFSNGLTVSKASGSLTLSQSMTFGGGIIVTAGTLNTNGQVVTLTSGNIENDGTMLPTTGTFVIAGSTSITGSGSIEFHNLTINNSGALTAPAELSIEGNFVNNGSFNANNGKLIFNGADQSISGSNTINAFDIDISSTGSSGVAVNGNVVLNGILTLTDASARFDADGSGSGVFTVASNGVNTGGRIAALPSTVNFSGDVTIERFLNGAGDWRYISMPISNGTAGQWQANFPVTGNFTDPSPNGVDGVLKSTAASIYFYNAATQAWGTIGSGASTGSTPIDPAVGYSVYTYKANVTSAVRGTINKGGFNIPLSPNGFNLIPNPYPSPIDWKSVSLPAGLADQVSLRVSNGSFATYAGGVTVNPPYVGWAGEVATGQSFYVTSSSASSLTLSENVKTNGNYQFLRTAEVDNYLRVVLSSPLQKDETVIRFSPEGTNGVDLLLDAQKQKNGSYNSSLGYNTYMNISSSVAGDNIDFAINTVSTRLTEKSIPLAVTDVSSGEYKLMFTELAKLKIGAAVTLIDHYLSTSTVVNQDSLVYDFTVDKNNALTYGKNRFELRFATIMGAEEDVASAFKVYPNPVKGKFTVVIPEQYRKTFKQLTILDAKGTVVYSRNADAMTQENEIDFSEKNDGIYLLNIYTDKKASVVKIIKN